MAMLNNQRVMGLGWEHMGFFMGFHDQMDCIRRRLGMINPLVGIYIIYNLAINVNPGFNKPQTIV
jgi:hypothetical protein